MHGGTVVLINLQNLAKYAHHPQPSTWADVLPGVMIAVTEVVFILYAAYGIWTYRRQQTTN